jgi:opacity protein-like surface antigen
MTTTAAQAQDLGNYYLKGTVGLSALQGNDVTLDGSTSDRSYDAGIAAGGAIGYNFANNPFRAEAEFMYRSGEAKDLPVGVGTGGDYASTTLMLNGYYAFATDTQFTPYVGAGLGYVTEIDFDIAGPTGEVEYSDRGLLAYQIMVGTEYAINDQLSLFGEARYFTVDSPKLSASDGSILEADYNTLELLAGVTWSF